MQKFVKKTLENKRWLEAEGFTVVEMRECQWKQLKRKQMLLLT